MVCGPRCDLASMSDRAILAYISLASELARELEELGQIVLA